jgi:hypothetical protein
MTSEHRDASYRTRYFYRHACATPCCAGRDDRYPHWRWRSLCLTSSCSCLPAWPVVVIFGLSRRAMWLAQTMLRMLVLEAQAMREHRVTARHNVRAKRAPTAGRQARAGENVPRTARPGLVACRWRSA